MRGKAQYVSGATLQSRITPAYAGKRPFLLSEIICWKDHPRLCGEKPPVGVPDNRITGSPPPMRGKVSKPLDVIGTPGITPAYAGKSCHTSG